MNRIVHRKKSQAHKESFLGSYQGRRTKGKGDEADPPRPGWMADPVLLPKKPPGK